LDQSKEYDVFISHASEDKEEIARPLAEKLRSLGMRVWYDEFSLHIGDSLNESIDMGIRYSHFGVVILSHNFFAKNWTREELYALYNKSQMLGRKIILPVWHKITKEQIYHYSTLLSDKYGIPTSRGIDYVASEILQEVMGRDRRLRYSSRSELPPFHMMLSLSKNTIDMSGLDFRIVVHSYIEIIRLHLKRGIQITFLLLDPNSQYVQTQSKNVYAGSDLKSSIEKTLGLLCSEKDKLLTNEKDNLDIRIYDALSSHSIILIDKTLDNNAWIKVEEILEGSDSNSRSSEAAFKKDDEDFFVKHSQEYNNLFNSSSTQILPP
jgi:hypothetical protein